jgi:hypothetical protein
MTIPPAALPPLAAVAACPAQPLTAFVVAGIDPLTIGTEFDFAKLRGLARETKRLGKHAPYGFYFSSVAYAISVEIGNDAQDVCTGPVTVRVSLRLTDRHIEVAQDFRNDPCRFPKMVAHYQHHADADKAAYQRYVPEVNAALAQMPASSLGDAYHAEHPKESIGRVAEDAIKPALDAMNIGRESMRQAVDTPAEVQELEGVCQDHT